MNISATRQNDMVAGLLAEYALGGLSRPARVLVESHLELTPDADRWLDDVAAIGGALSGDKHSEHAGSVQAADGPSLDGFEPAELKDADEALSSVFDAIDSAGATPLALQRFLGMNIEDVPWKRVMPGLAEYKLPDMDGSEVSLLRIDGGKGMPVHTHHGSEITLVLQGGFSDGNGHYGVGDIAYADDDVNHKPVADPGEVCICFAVVDAPLELTGPIGRLMNSFLR